MLRLLSRLRLRGRILASFSLAGFIAICIFGASWWAMDDTLASFRRFAGLSERARFELQVTQSVSELQRHVQSYTSLGHTSAAHQVEDVYGALTKELSRRAETSDDESEPYLGAISRHLETYFETFGVMQAQRARRTELAATLEANGEAAERALTALGRDDAPILLQEMLRARRYAQRYFEQLDTNDVATAKAALGRIDRTLMQGAQAPVSEARAAVTAYRKSFLEAVQRTRGYLFLVNVVMAAEAYEILYAARKLEQLNKDRMAAEVLAASQELESTVQAITGLVIGMLIVLLVLSANLYRSITDPISQLSATFRELARGRRDLVVPSYAVADEIGELTNAASVFRDRNIETERLLARANALTAELEDKQVALTRSNDELEQFVYTVSHDLKSPLVTSMGFITIAKRLADRGQMEDAAAKLDRVVKANERMSTLINDLLDLSRVGRVDIEASTLSLPALLTELKGAIEPRLKRAGIELVLQDELPMVTGNESRVLQVFENLVGNALKYACAPQGSRIEVGATREEGATLVFVADDGPGIAPEYREKVFGLFHRLDNSAPGTGIGLTVVRKIMRFHGGDAWVDAATGGGARFWLRFPDAPRTEAEAA